jgi:hypothetical protein
MTAREFPDECALTVRFTPPHWEAVAWETWEEHEGISVPGVREVFGAHGLAWPQVTDPACARLLRWVADPPRWLRPGLNTGQKLAAAFEADPALREWVQSQLEGVRLVVGTGVLVPRTAKAKGAAIDAIRRGEPWEAEGLVVAYQVTGAAALAVLELAVAAQAGLVVRVCRKCGVPYVPVPGNARYCGGCREDATRQQLYYWRRKEAMSEAEREEQRRRWREAQRRHRQKARR